jgi:hypothetical protein
MEALDDAAAGVLSTLRDVLPIAAIIFGFQFAIVRRRPPNLRRVLLGFVWVVIGLALFLLGLETALFPLGKVMAEQLTSQAVADSTTIVDWRDHGWIYAFAFMVGFSTTIAEPSLIAVALKASEVSGGAISAWGLRIAVAFGVALGIALGCYRIVVGDPIQWYIMGGYAVVVVQTVFAPRIIVPLAYDSGGVTTSTVTVPLVAALGIGLAQAIPGRDPLIDGFGLIAFASVFPIISVMAYAQLSQVWSRRSVSDARID